MTNRRFNIAVVMLFVAIVLGVFASWAFNKGGPFSPKPHTPNPEATLVVDSRAIPINLDTVRNSGIYYVAWTIPSKITPVPRPTEHPLYPSNYPLGIDVLDYFSAQDPGPGGSIADPLWDTAPTGCTTTWCTTSNINWTVINNAVASSKQRTVKLGNGIEMYQPISLVLPGSYLDTQGGVCGQTASDPCNSLHLPTWMGAGVYYDFQSPSGRYFRTLRWDSAVLRARFKQLVYEAAQQYQNNADWRDTIRLVRVYIGLAGESNPVQAKTWTSDDGTDSQRQLLKAAEDKLTELVTGAPPTSSTKYIGCDKYLSFMREITEYTYSQFKDLLPVVIMDAPGPCSYDNQPSYDSGEKLRNRLYNDATYGWEVTSPKKKIGSSINALQAQASNADTCPTCVRQGYQWKTTGETMFNFGSPFVMETGYSPSNSVVWDNWQDQYWSALSLCQVKGDAYMMNSYWQPYMSTEMWRVIENCMGRKTGTAFIQFRNSELTTARYVGAGGWVGVSDYRGTYGSWLSLINYNNYAQACTPFFKALADADYASAVNSGWTIDRRACQMALPTPVITPNPTATPNSPDMTNRLYNRQVLQIESDANQSLSRFDVKLDTTHPLYGQDVTLSVDITYFDNGTDKFFANFPTNDGAVRQILITKTNTNQWTTSKGNVLNDMKMANTLIGLTSENVFFYVGNDNTGPDYIGSVYVDASPITGPTPTPSPTPSPVPEPTETLTPTPSPTPSPVAGIHFSEIANNPLHDWNLSGSINAADRWFEITNWTGSSINLKGYTVEVGAGGNAYVISGNATVPAYGRRVFASDSLGGLVIPTAGTLKLQNTQGGLVDLWTYAYSPETECVATWPEGSDNSYAESACTPGRSNINPF